MKKPPPLKLNMRSLSTNSRDGRAELIEAIRKQGKLSLTCKNKWIPPTVFPQLISKVETEHKFEEIIDGEKVSYRDLGPLVTDFYKDSRKNSTLERSKDALPWFYNRASPDNLHGETIEKDKARGEILKKKLKQLRYSVARERRDSMLHLHLSKC